VNMIKSLRRQLKRQQSLDKGKRVQSINFVCFEIETPSHIAFRKGTEASNPTR